VRAFFRDIANRNEFEGPDAKDFFDLTESKAFDVDVETNQKALKQEIRRRLGNDGIATIPFTCLKRENARIVVDASEKEIQKFCHDVETRLWTIIEWQIRDWHKLRSSEIGSVGQSFDQRIARELEIERDEHLRFGNVRSLVGARR